MPCLFDIVHHTFTLGEFIVASMVVKGLSADQVQQLCFFTIPGNVKSCNSPYMSKLKLEFNYSTIASTIQLFNYSGEGRGRS